MARASRPRVTRFMNGVALPPSLWLGPEEFAPRDYNWIYGTCKKGACRLCVNTQYVKRAAKLRGRTIRYVYTDGGYLVWSELTYDGFGNPVWVQFRALLAEWYAKKIDKYDATSSQFKIPTRDPFGPTEYVEHCAEPRNRTKDQRETGRAKHTARAKAGTARKNRNTQRLPQLPIVQQILAAA